MFSPSGAILFTPPITSAPSISFIIPTLDEADHLPATLASIQGQNADAQIIVSDAGSQDRTQDIARKAGALIVNAPKGRGLQMNSGAARAEAKMLCFLHADTRLPPHAISSIQSILENPRIIAGSFPLAFDKERPLYRLFALCSRINHTLFTYGDQALFLRKESFEKLGGFKDFPFLEDIEMQQRLRNRGRFEKAQSPVLTSARRFERNGPLRQQLLNIAIVAAYLSGASPQTLARFYR